MIPNPKTEKHEVERTIEMNTFIDLLKKAKHVDWHGSTIFISGFRVESVELDEKGNLVITTPSQATLMAVLDDLHDFVVQYGKNVYSINSMDNRHCHTFTLYNE